MVMLLALHPMESISLNSSVLLEYLANARKQGIGIISLQKTFSKFYQLYYGLKSKFQIGLKFLLRQRLLEPECYGDVLYKA